MHESVGRNGEQQIQDKDPYVNVAKAKDTQRRIAQAREEASTAKAKAAKIRRKKKGNGARKDMVKERARTRAKGAKVCMRWMTGGEEEEIGDNRKQIVGDHHHHHLQE